AQGNGADVAVRLEVAGFVGEEVHAQLYELEVPVAELAPEELVNGVGGFVETIFPQRALDFGGDGREAGEDPTGFEGCGLRQFECKRVVRVQGDFVAGFTSTLNLHLQEAGGVPDFVREGAVALGAGFGEGDVRAGRSLRGEGETHRIRTVFLNDLDWVDHVALGLRHLLTIGVADQRVDVHVAEGNRVRKRARRAIGHRNVEHKVAAEHDHPRNPEEQDVEAGDE